MPKLLEVIVTSVDEAKQAEQGGADRLELVRAFELGGLTPPPKLVEQVVAAVSIPVRVMLRENASMAASDAHEIGGLQTCAAQLAQLPIDGFVLGFVKNGGLDLEAMDRVLAAAPASRVTLHRAFKHASSNCKRPQRRISGYSSAWGSAPRSSRKCRNAPNNLSSTSAERRAFRK